MQTNGIFDVRQSLFICIALCITSLQLRAVRVITVIVPLNHHGKMVVRYVPSLSIAGLKDGMSDYELRIAKEKGDRLLIEKGKGELIG